MTPDEVRGGRPSVPDGAGDPDGAGGPDRAGNSGLTERRRRLQDLAGLTVRGSDGGSVGRVRDIYQQDAGIELAAITVVPRQLSSRSVLIPAAAIASLPPASVEVDDSAVGDDPAGSDGPAGGDRPADDGGADHRRRGSTENGAPPVIELRIDVATAKAGARPPVTGHLTPEELREAASVLGLGTDHGA